VPVDIEHEWQIEHNAQLLSEPLLDITIMFYKAVHVIDKALAERGVVDIWTHEKRKENIQKHLRGLFGYFQAFEELSRKTRYEVLRPTATDMNDAIQQQHQACAPIRDSGRRTGCTGSHRGLLPCTHTTKAAE